MNKTILAATAFAATLLASCASTLPKETVRLSVLLEKQIDVLEKTNIGVTDAYFKEKKLQAKALVDNKMYPEWLNDFFAKDAVKKEWGKTVTEDSAQRIESLKAIVEIVQKEYNTLLQSATEPLEKQHAESLALIHEEYQKTRSMARTIVESVSSVHDIQKAREQLFPQKIMDAENALHQYMQEADAVIDAMRDAQSKFGTRKGD